MCTAQPQSSKEATAQSRQGTGGLLNRAKRCRSYSTDSRTGQTRVKRGGASSRQAAGLTFLLVDRFSSRTTTATTCHHYRSQLHWSCPRKTIYFTLHYKEQHSKSLALPPPPPPSPITPTALMDALMLPLRSC